ncbi:hypothetical protein BaRGS_00032495 [Batillaria attramentaria]|uniref:Uncharacterized protein n=1 Tax=Batillaria attramentaria TaxID=370345 RepID=A0ABD0JMZ0_9CAEN
MPDPMNRHYSLDLKFKYDLSQQHVPTGAVTSIPDRASLRRCLACACRLLVLLILHLLYTYLARSEQVTADGLCIHIKEKEVLLLDGCLHASAWIKLLLAGGQNERL